MPTRPLVLLSTMLLAGACSEPDAGGLPELVPTRVPAETSTDQALRFDGVAHYASTANSSFPKANIDQSIVLWVKPESSDGEQAIVTIRRGSESGTQLGISEGRLRVWSVWGPRVFVESEPLELGAWLHVGFVQDEIDEEAQLYDQRLYLNGELVAQGTLPPQVRTPTSSWLGSYDGFSSLYTGWLDEVSIYARALSDSEIAEHRASGQVSEAALVAHWTFNETPDSMLAFDRSDHGNHATLGDGVPLAMPERRASER